jgi:tetratricopeptide (TPR) repeat protein
VVGDVAFAAAIEDSSLTDLQRAEQVSPPWPQYPGVRAHLLHQAAATLGDERLGRRAIAAERAAIDRDPADPRWWYALGALEERWGSTARARAAYRAALARNPWSYTALVQLYELELDAGNRAWAVAARERLCAIEPSECPPPPRVIERRERSGRVAEDRRASTP